MISTGGKGGLKSRLRRKESGANLEELTMMIMMTLMVIMIDLGLWRFHNISVQARDCQQQRATAHAKHQLRWKRNIIMITTILSSWSITIILSSWSQSSYHHDHHHPIIMITIMIMIRILKILSRVRLPPHASPPPWGGKAVQGCHSPTDGWVSFHFMFLMVWNTSYFKLPIKSWYINDFLLG